MNETKSNNTTIVFLSSFILATFFIVGLWLTDINVSEAKTPAKHDAGIEFEVHTDSGMLVNAETRAYKLEIKQLRPVSFQVTGVGGDINCAVFNDDNDHIAHDDSATDGCNIRFVPETLGSYIFILRNVSDNVERFSASVVY